MLQVKKNCPALYEEVMELFNGLSEEQENDKKGFLDKYGDHYSEIETSEKNRERYEYRKCQSYSDPDGIKGLQEEPPHVASVGRMFQVRIMQVQDELGNDIQWAGLVSSRSLTAEEMLEYKRQHWTVENRLHYVLDETFGEDKSTIKKGKNTMSTLRKCSYNIVRLLQMKDQKGREYVPDIIDDICDDLEIDLRMIFSPIPSFY